MPSRRWFYISLGVVFVCSVGAMFLFPAESVSREIVSMPAVGSLVGALFRIFIDEAAFQKQLLLEAHKENFSLKKDIGVAS